MKYKNVYIFLVLTALFYERALATVELNISKDNVFKLTVAFDRSVSYKLYDSITLFSNDQYFVPERDIDSTTKMYTLRWSDLPKNEYSLKIKTVFGDNKMYNFNLQKDTSFIVANKYDLTDLQKIEVSNYRKSDRIQLYFKSDGCFHDYKEIFLIERKPSNSYMCTLTRDSVTYKDTMGRTMILEIPTHQIKYVNASIIDNLFELIKISNGQQNIVKKTRPECISTTYKKLFVLSDSLLFQFSDYGICDWNSYNDFVRRYFKEE